MTKITANPIIVLAVFFAMILVYSSCAFAVPAAQDLSVCTDQKLGIQFSCDPDWKIETDENVLMVIMSDHPSVTMTITKTYPAPSSLDELTMPALKEIGGYADGFTVYRMVLNDRSLVEVRGVSAKIPDLQLHDYYFLDGQNLFGILFAVEPFDALSAYDSLIKSIISSLKFLPQA